MAPSATTYIKFYSIISFYSPFAPSTAKITHVVTMTKEIIVYTEMYSPKKIHASIIAKHGAKLHTTLVIDTLKSFMAVY